MTDNTQQARAASIPDAAIEAAAKAIHEAGGWNCDTPWTGDDWRADCARTEARAALEAAAPHMQGDLLEEWAVQFGSGSVEEADDRADAEQKLAEIREAIQDGIENKLLEPMQIVRRYRVGETELTLWKVVVDG